jgi:uncharacterized repeat protein (TIGR03803 family)
MSRLSQLRQRFITSKLTVTPAAIFVLALAITPSASSQSFQSIHRFTGGDGEHPYAGLTMDAGGKLYGTTSEGGSSDYGTVFRLVRAGSGWVLNTLYNFQGLSDGISPRARVILGPDGALYGTTYLGGSTNCGNGCGTIFRLQPPSNACKTALCPWIKTIIHTFGGTREGNDGRNPVGDLIFDEQGNLFGVTNGGGQYDVGMVYELTRTANGWTESVVHSFTTLFGNPVSGLALDQNGNFYGTAQRVVHYFGGVYRLVPSGTGWTEEDLYKFQAGDDGGWPMSGVILDDAGNVYGTASSFGPNGGGTIFELSPSNGGWSFSLLFGLVGRNGGPQADLMFDGAGNLYGTTIGDGAFQYGSVFKLTPGSGGWSYTSLYDFNDPGVATNPLSSVVRDASGNLYGTNAQGSTPFFCSGGCGGVWEISP